MEVNKLFKNISNFLVNRFIEVFGLMLSILSILLLVSLLSYSPDDPNFIFPENTQIKNFLGFRGSFISDFFFQSIGLISILVSVTFFVTGINIIRNKKIIIILQNFFYLILYSILSSLFFSIYYSNSFWLSINGNGGFVGKMLNETFLKSIIELNMQISYYVLIVAIIILFLISINFNIVWFAKSLKSLIIKLFSNKKKVSNEYMENTNNIEEAKVNNNKLIQEDLPFAQDEGKIARNKYKLPSIDFLNFPTKKERNDNSEENNIDQDFLEKILLDFGVEGKIKKISHGPVVTLNEFEPAPGIKVSKIINLSEDIARNTSSESARISTIPGKNTVGIELPKSSRENVYLSEIINEKNFKKKDIKLPIALGKDISGLPITGDLYSMPHLLIAGTTGSGKSVNEA